MAAFRAADIAVGSEAMRFERDGARPDGSPVKVGFSLAFAEDRLAPDIHFAACQQHYPENFWNPAFQQHGNGVERIAGVVLVADAPAPHRDFLLAFAAAQNTHGAGDGFRIDLPRGTLDMMTPAALVRRFGVGAPDTTRGARLAESTLKRSEILSVIAEGAVVVGREAAMGAVLVFELDAAGDR